MLQWWAPITLMAESSTLALSAAVVGTHYPDGRDIYASEIVTIRVLTIHYSVSRAGFEQRDKKQKKHVQQQQQRS